MKIIKVWWLHTQPAEYTTDRRTGNLVHNWYNDSDNRYLYSGEEAMRTFREYAEDYKKTWKKHGEQIGYPSDVCHMCALLVPVRDEVTLPEDANELFCSMITPQYLDGVCAEDIVPELELPCVGTFYTLLEDGEVIHGDGSTADPQEWIPRWKAAGWNGEVTEV